MRSLAQFFYQPAIEGMVAEGVAMRTTLGDRIFLTAVFTFFVGITVYAELVTASRAKLTPMGAELRQFSQILKEDVSRIESLLRYAERVRKEGEIEKALLILKAGDGWVEGYTDLKTIVSHTSYEDLAYLTQTRGQQLFNERLNEARRNFLDYSIQILETKAVAYEMRSYNTSAGIDYASEAAAARAEIERKRRMLKN